MQTFRTYRYHTYSPCMYDISQRKAVARLCKDDQICADSNMFGYANAKTPNAVKTLTPIGIARDGRVIYGPYKAVNALW